MASSPKKKKVALICGATKGTGGLFLALHRHVSLLKDMVDIVCISLEKTSVQADCIGRIEQQHAGEGFSIYRVCAADLMTDKLEGGHGSQHREHTYAECIVEIARREQIDTVHVFGCYESRALIGAYAAARLNLPLILTFRGVDLAIRCFGPALPGLRLAIDAAAACVCVNEDAARLLRNLFHPACSVHVIPNHVNPDVFDTEAKPSYAPRNDAPTLGMIAEFRRVTGLDTLLRAFEELSQTRELNLLLMGPIRPIEAPYYLTFMERLNSSSRILCTGRIDHERVLAHLQACDVLVFPSLTEGSPNKVLEAMLSQRPIVASAVPGIIDVICDRKEGLLVPPRDAEALAEAITELLDDQQLSRTLATAAAKRVATEFTEQAERDRWTETLKGVDWLP